MHISTYSRGTANAHKRVHTPEERQSPKTAPPRGPSIQAHGPIWGHCTNYNTPPVQFYYIINWKGKSEFLKPLTGEKGKVFTLKTEVCSNFVQSSIISRL